MLKVILVKTPNTIKQELPLLLRRLQERPACVDILASGHRTAATTQGSNPEMVDQQEDATRYDQD